MNKKIKTQLDQLNKDLEQLLQRMATYPEDLLNQQPDENSWSAFQVMHHLMLVEQASIHYVQKKLSFQPQLKKAGLGARLRSFIIWLYLTLPLKAKAPALVSGDKLPKRSNLEDIRTAWTTQRKALEAYLETLPDEIWDKAIYKNFGGRLSLGQMLKFYKDHFEHHLKQIDRTIGHVSS